MLAAGVFGVVIFNCLLVLWLLVRPARHGAVVAVDDIAQIAGPLLGVVLFGVVARRNRHGYRDANPLSGNSRLHRWAPTLLVLGALSFAVGQAVWAYYELVLNQATPFPSLADMGYLSAYPFFFFGVLLLPVRRVSLTSRTRVLLDGLLILSAIVTFSWYFILGPTLLQGGETALAKVVGTAYPICDLILVCCVLLLSARSRDRLFRPAIRMLSAGLAAIVITDTIFDYQTLHGTYATGGIVDVGWPLGYMLIALGALAARLRATGCIETRTEPDKGAEMGAQPRLWQVLAPYVLAPAVAALMVYAGHVRGDEAVEPGVYVGGGVLIALVLIRQILVILENRQLYREMVDHAARLRATQEELQRSHDVLAEANQRLEALAVTDPLTGLPNHRAMVASLDHELERAHRYHRPFALLFMDIDHFKALNDGYGHPTGDAALQGFAAIVRASLRGSDVLGRWGGEEFVALLPETDADTAKDVGERIRATVAGHRLPVAGGAHLTCSVGVARFPDDAADRGTLIELADRAMYAAKRLGRNQVRLTDDPAVAALSDEVDEPGTREEATLIGTVEALASLVQARDYSTGHHIDEVAALSMRLGERLGLEAADIYHLRIAAWLHDVGKVAIPDAVLQKPARLTEEEWVLMRTHPAVGADVVSHVPGLRVLAPVIRGHHERWDGKGYPDGLVGEAIPLAARIIAVADAYLTITRHRPYQQARTRVEALAEIRRCSGTQFDPSIVETFGRLLVETPPLRLVG